MKISDRIKGFTVKQLYAYLDKDPDANIPKVLDYLEKHDESGKGITDQIKGIHQCKEMGIYQGRCRMGSRGG